MVAVLVVAGFLTGCAVPQEMRSQQWEESKAVAKYHMAEKKQYRAGEVLKAAKVAVVVATGAKVKADIDLKEAKQNMDEVLAK